MVVVMGGESSDSQRGRPCSGSDGHRGHLRQPVGRGVTRDVFGPSRSPLVTLGPLPSTQVQKVNDASGLSLSPPGTTSGVSLPLSGLGGVYDVTGLDTISMAVASMPNLHSAR
jgi:hypothetical protein